MTQDEMELLRSEALRWKKAYEDEKTKVAKLIPYARMYHARMLESGNVLEQLIARRALDELKEMA
jgi:hypothetical protein